MDINAPIPNAAYPTAGQGLTLDLNGRIPASVLPTGVFSQVDYVEYTGGSINPTGTTEATATTLLTSSSLTFDGTSTYLFEVSSPMVEIDGNQAIIHLKENATVKGQLMNARAPGDTRTDQKAFYAQRQYVPTAGTYTIKIEGWVAFGTAFKFYGGAGGSGTRFPAFLRISKKS